MKAKKVEVFLFIDALGWEIVNRFDFLSGEFPCRYPVRMQFGYSSTAIPTILSGRHPQEHGHLSFFYYDREGSPFGIFRFLPWSNHPKAPWNRGRVRGWISRIFRVLKRYTGYFQLYQMPFDRLKYFNYCEKKNLFRPGGLAPFRNLADLLAESGLRYHIADWRKKDAENFSIAEDLLAEGNTEFYFIYAAELDGLLHFQVLNPDAIRKKLDFYEEYVRKMLDTLRRGGQDFSFTIISDHGMTPLAGTVDLKKAVESLGLEFGRDYVACYDSTLFRVWFLRPGAKEKIMGAVNPETFPGHYVSEEEKKRYGIDFKDHKYGDEIFLLNPGVQIVPSDMGAKPLPGMHGFLPEDKDSTAVILSTSAVKQPEEVADYFDLMRERIQQLRAEKNS